MHQALSEPHLISLAAGFVDQQTLPAELISAAMDELWSNGITARQALQYGTTAGFPPLRDAILTDHLQSDRLQIAECDLSVDNVVLTAGSNQLLHLVAESLLDPGDIVLCSSPTYFVFLGTLQGLGARPIGVAADREGMVIEGLQEELHRLDSDGQLHRVKAIYVVSYFDNPRSLTLTESRRRELVETIQRYKRRQQIYIIEDVAYRQLRYHAEDVPSLFAFADAESRENIVVAGTFSKSFSPGLRIGWGILPDELMNAVCVQKGNIDFGSPNLNQQLMHCVLELGQYQAHVERIRAQYRKKLEVMLRGADESLASLSGVDWIRPAGGLYVWVELPSSIETGPSGKLFDRAIEEGVLYVPGEYCFPPEGKSVRKNTIRLSFGVQSPERITHGLQALGRAIRDVL